MTTNCREQQLPIDTVEVSFNIDIEHPVISPAALTGLAHRIDRRLAGSVAVGVGMKHWLQYRLQVTTDDLLSAAVGDSWNTQRPRPAPCFRNIDPPHRRRKVAPRGHAIPEFVEVARKVGLKRRNRLSVHPSRSLIRLHTFEGFPDFPFGDLERLCLVHGLLPSPDGFSWPMALAEQRSPLAPAPLQSLRHYYGLSVPALRFGTLALAVGAACDLSLGIGEQVLTFRTKAWSSFAPPTCRMPLGPSQASPELIPEEGSPPGFDIV